MKQLKLGMGKHEESKKKEEQESGDETFMSLTKGFCGYTHPLMALRDLPFPAVTVCNFNAIRLNKLLDSDFTDLINTIKKQNYPEGDEGDEDDEYDYNYWGEEDVEDPEYLDPEFFASEKVSLLLAGKDKSYLSSLGHQFEDMVLSCTYRGISCSNFTDKFWTKYWHYKYGNCFVFNRGLTSSGSKRPTLKSNKAGPSHGLNIEINIEQDEYLDYFTPEAGVRLDISSQGYMPFPMERGLSLPAGFASAIGLRKVILGREDPFNNNRCLKNSSTDKSNLYTKMFNATYSSTVRKSRPMSLLFYMYMV
ncbi:ligand-gated sodium channel [Desmophyllum pertusum]|uniref:Ligand-gated sodium channel n=1 Tax=Desmophyllum pertusum TaxID=174260 RepID=A0A9W9ZQ82_9CNID|nr:ligand-gated sodium channel [Desmophyllum pertusum]